MPLIHLSHENTRPDRTESLNRKAQSDRLLGPEINMAPPSRPRKSRLSRLETKALSAKAPQATFAN
jgi:hypothetical protein